MQQNQIMDTRKYTIFNANEINDIDPSKIASNIRWSVDGSKFIVKWITTPENEYITHEEATLILDSPEWINQIDEI